MRVSSLSFDQSIDFQGLTRNTKLNKPQNVSFVWHLPNSKTITWGILQTLHLQQRLQVHVIMEGPSHKGGQCSSSEKHKNDRMDKPQRTLWGPLFRARCGSAWVNLRTGIPQPLWAPVPMFSCPCCEEWRMLFLYAVKIFLHFNLSSLASHPFTVCLWEEKFIFPAPSHWRAADSSEIQLSCVSSSLSWSSSFNLPLYILDSGLMTLLASNPAHCCHSCTEKAKTGCSTRDVVSRAKQGNINLTCWLHSFLHSMWLLFPAAGTHCSFNLRIIDQVRLKETTMGCLI